MSAAAHSMMLKRRQSFAEGKSSQMVVGPPSEGTGMRKLKPCPSITRSRESVRFASSVTRPAEVNGEQKPTKEDASSQHNNRRSRRSLNAEIDKERDRLAKSLQAPKWKVHPKGKWKKRWDWLVFLLVLYMAFATPWSLGFTQPDDELILKPTDEQRIALSDACRLGVPVDEELQPLKYAIILPDTPSIVNYLDTITEIVFFLDLLITFRTGYHKKGSSAIEFRSRAIAKRYAKSWFLFDLVACVPLEQLVSAMNLAENSKDLLMLKMMRLPRLVRLSRLMKEMEHMASANIFRVLKLLMYYVTVSHWVCCGFFFQARWQIENLKTGATNRFTGEPWIRQQCLTMADYKTQYSMALHWSFTTMTTVGYGDILPTTNMDRLFTVAAMLIGGLLQAVIFGNVSVLLQNLDAATSRLQDRLDGLKEVISFMHIPEELSQRMLDSAEYQYNFNQGMRTDVILENFSYALATDLRAELMREMISRMPIFRDNGVGFVRAVVGHFQPRIYIPDEIVVEEGDAGKEAFFIQDGKCEVTSGDGRKTYATLRSGDFFGEIDVVLGTKRNATVRTVMYSTMFCLTRESLQEVLEDFPHLVEAIKCQALERKVELAQQNMTSSHQNTSDDHSAHPSSTLLALFNTVKAPHPEICVTTSLEDSEAVGMEEGAAHNEINNRERDEEEGGLGEGEENCTVPLLSSDEIMSTSPLKSKNTKVSDLVVRLKNNRPQAMRGGKPTVQLGNQPLAPFPAMKEAPQNPVEVRRNEALQDLMARNEDKFSEMSEKINKVKELQTALRERLMQTHSTTLQSKQCI